MSRLPDGSRSPRCEEVEPLFCISEKRAAAVKASVERLRQGRARAGGGKPCGPRPRSRCQTVTVTAREPKVPVLSH